MEPNRHYTAHFRACATGRQRGSGSAPARMRMLGLLIPLLLVGPIRTVHAEDEEASIDAFVQVGGYHLVESYAIGIGIPVRVEWLTDSPQLSARIDVEIAAWHPHAQGVPGEIRDATQFGVTPYLRYSPRFCEGCYVEAGIGLQFVVPAYHDRDKQFSTAFNFGDALAIGKVWGVRRANDLSLRIEHFSNAGIKEPNPGQNFIQIRYARSF